MLLSDTCFSLRNGEPVDGYVRELVKRRALPAKKKYYTDDGWANVDEQHEDCREHVNETDLSGCVLSTCLDGPLRHVDANRGRFKTGVEKARWPGEVVQRGLKRSLVRNPHFQVYGERGLHHGCWPCR